MSFLLITLITLFLCLFYLLLSCISLYHGDSPIVFCHFPFSCRSLPPLVCCIFPFLLYPWLCSFDIVPCLIYCSFCIFQHFILFLPCSYSFAPLAFLSDLICIQSYSLLFPCISITLLVNCLPYSFVFRLPLSLSLLLQFLSFLSPCLAFA